MKQLICLFLLCFATLQLQAQPGAGFKERLEARGERFAKIKEAREAFIAEQLELTPRQAEAFFPVFWSYEEKMRDGLPRRDRKDGETTAPLTETQALAQLRSQQAQRQQLLALKTEAEEAFLKIIPATKVIRLPEVEKEFRQKLWERTRQAKDRLRN